MDKYRLKNKKMELEIPRLELQTSGAESSDGEH